MSAQAEPPWEEPEPSAAFDGDTYVFSEDFERLNRQQRATWMAMTSPPRWYTLAELAERVGASEASVSARLRDLRKARYGGHEVQRLRMGGGLFVYRLVPAEPKGS